MIQVYITSATPRVSDRRSLPPTRRLRRARRPARDVAARGGGAARGHDLPRPRRGHLAPLSRATSRRAPRTRLPVERADARWAAADPPRPDQAPRSTSCRTRSSSRAAARTCATSATRRPSSRAAASFYTQTVDAALAEIERLPGRHLYFLDDHLFGDRRFATALFDGMRGMGRLWQAAGTVNSRADAGPARDARSTPGCAACSSASKRSNAANLAEQRKFQNLRRDYGAAIRRLHDLGVMINGSFVFGMDARRRARCSSGRWSGRSSRASRPPRSTS